MHPPYKNKSSIKLIIQSIVIIFASLALSGCGTTSTVRDTSAVTQVDTVKKFQLLIDKKEWQKAYEYYSANDKALVNSEDGRKLADKLSDQIQRTWEIETLSKGQAILSQ